jgi:hypothetical protein
MFAPSGHDDRLTNGQLQQRFPQSERDPDRMRKARKRITGAIGGPWRKKAPPGFAGRGVEDYST